jgi:polysaccharide export outer membrane protein
MLSKFRGCSSLPILLASIALLLPASAQTSNETAEPSAAIANKSIDTADSRSAGRPHDEGFLIGPDDVLAVNVWKEPEISRAVPVRSDGKISLPLVGELQASGQTPKQLEEEIAAKLHGYISEPEVTVIVQEIKSQRINILGQVAKPGSYLLTNTMTVLDSIALAGGFKDFAKQKAVYVLRRKPDGTQVRIPFNYKDVIKGRNPDQNVKLEPRDTVVIP